MNGLDGRHRQLLAKSLPSAINVRSWLIGARDGRHDVSCLRPLAHAVRLADNHLAIIDSRRPHRFRDCHQYPRLALYPRRRPESTPAPASVKPCYQYHSRRPAFVALDSCGASQISSPPEALRR